MSHRVDAAAYSVLPRVWRARWERDVRDLLERDPLEAPIGFLQADRAEGLWSELPEEAHGLLARAREVSEGRVRYFGLPAVDGDLATTGDVDPFTGRRWPSKHGKRIDYRRGTVGDPKWIWELNRCQELPLLLAAWLVSEQPSFAQASRDRLMAWIRSHPPGRGIAWSSGFEAGMRALSLAVAFDGLRGSGLLTREDEGQILRSLWQHAVWIERDPSIGSSTNNHRIGELVALVAVGALAPELLRAGHWLDVGAEGLEREAVRQIRPDGTSVEQAFAYHVFVLDLLLVAVAALDVAGRPIPESLRSAAERSGDALWAQLGDDEPAPTYGDTDDGRALVLDGADLRDPRGVAAGIAARFAHAKSARVAGGMDPTAWWLFGAAGAERISGLQDAPAAESVELPDGGLTVLRRGRMRLLFDHGPHGYLSLAAHAHADALGVELSVGSTPLVVDPGVGSYFARPDVRDAFRGTGFHATVTVDGMNSSDPGGAFLWTRHAGSRLLYADLETGVLVAEHDGYQRLDDPVVHRRAILLLGEDSILVVDRMEGRAVHRYSQRWPLHPDLELERESANRILAPGEETGLALVVAGTHPVMLSAVRGETDPWAGWWSQRLESYVPSWLVSLDVEAEGPTEIVTLLAPLAASAPAVHELGLERNADVTRIVIEGNPRHVVELELGGSPVVRRNESET